MGGGGGKGVVEGTRGKSQRSGESSWKRLRGKADRRRDGGVSSPDAATRGEY